MASDELPEATAAAVEACEAIGDPPQVEEVANAEKRVDELLCVIAGISKMNVVSDPGVKKSLGGTCQ